MANQVWGRHTKHLTTSQDNTKEISTNEWNDNTNRKGHLGFDPITIASGSTVTPPAFSTTVANQPSSFIKLSGSTSVDTIAITNTSEGDLLYITTTGSVTLNNTTSPSSAGDIRLLGNANKDLDTNVPTILIRSGNFWYEYGGSPVTDASITFAKIQNLASMKVIGRTAGSSGVSSEVTILDSDTMSGASDSTLATSESIKAYVDNNVSSVTASSTDTFTNKSIDLSGNTLTGTSLELKTAISDETGSGSLVFATSPTLVTPALGTPASGTLTNCTFPTLNQSTTGNSATVTTNANLTGDVTSTGNATAIGAGVIVLADIATSAKTESLIIAAGDETSDLSTGINKVRFRMPYAFTLTAVRASVNVAPVGSTLTVDINEAGSTILSTKLTIASGSTTSVGGTAPVISDSSLADDAIIGIDIDQIGSSTAGTGLKVTLIGYQT